MTVTLIVRNRVDDIQKILTPTWYKSKKHNSKEHLEILVRLDQTYVFNSARRTRQLTSDSGSMPIIKKYPTLIQRADRKELDKTLIITNTS